MLYTLYTAYSLLMVIALSAVLAVWKGGWAERVGAGVNLLAALSFELAQRQLAGDALATTTLVLDGVLALSFLGLTLRFAKTWLGLAMLLQAMQFALHAYYYVVERKLDALFAIVNNLVSWGLIACIVGGVAGHWASEHRRRRAVLHPL
ncbi:hypothetical protein [Phenylobacterium sp.]|uniref:hypothetical protein n=1 Tax=Phenylobacterium sp. TaxID=1871053 RepID=UPI0028110FF6|nr:hypothetical protein [Phenylobacterium sp.]